MLVFAQIIWLILKMLHPSINPSINMIIRIIRIIRIKCNFFEILYPV